MNVVMVVVSQQVVFPMALFGYTQVLSVGTCNANLRALASSCYGRSRQLQGHGRQSLLFCRLHQNFTPKRPARLAYDNSTRS